MFRCAAPNLTYNDLCYKCYAALPLKKNVVYKFKVVENPHIRNYRKRFSAPVIFLEEQMIKNNEGAAHRSYL